MFRSVMFPSYLRSNSAYSVMLSFDKFEIHCVCVRVRECARTRRQQKCDLIISVEGCNVQGDELSVKVVSWDGEL
jgi:hypothetical protein